MSPIDDSSYDPTPPSAPQRFYPEDDFHHRQSFYQPQPQPVFQPQPPLQQQSQGGGFFAQFDNITWIVIGLLVLIAFFMGKTMQPVILKA